MFPRHFINLHSLNLYIPYHNPTNLNVTVDKLSDKVNVNGCPLPLPIKVVLCDRNLVLSI